ncbi:MAG: hypothetical protein IPJ48_17090 [Propionivibrio sp.]|uniref:Uncharacterized protein n=1 Tax=Candidatus Propionivibrio dominans TaxID=2954373 RepID=A0A9D7IHT8_9RHOO|nr:hypothetical protein [Candidatus Propionivibrio dominans]
MKRFQRRVRRGAENAEKILAVTLDGGFALFTISIMVIDKMGYPDTVIDMLWRNAAHKRMSANESVAVITAGPVSTLSRPWCFGKPDVHV